jgi:hypothetical protein
MNAVIVPLATAGFRRGLLSRAVYNNCSMAHYDADGAGVIHPIRIAAVGFEIT